MKKNLFLFICCFSFLLADYAEMLHAQGTRTVVYDPVQYPGYPVKTIYIPVAKTGKDSIPLHLIQAVQSADIVSNSVLVNPLIWSGNWPQLYWGEQYPPYVYDWNFPIGTFAFWVTPACGDSFHKNGQLSSSIECVDSVMHGKAFFWDETGHKTSESTYSEGHQIKQKAYDNRGRITSVTHFDYQGQYHGICIYYNYYDGSNTKTVSRYNHGTLDGWQEEYTNGILTTKTNYKSGEAISEQSFYTDGKVKRSLIKTNGHVLSDIELNSKGDTIFYQKGNESGQLEFVRRWYDDGTIYQDCTYENGRRYGTWLLGYNPQTGIFQKEIYENGNKVLYLHGSDELIFNRTEYLNGNLFKQTLRNEKGDTTSNTVFHADGNIAYQKKWSEAGFVQHEYSTENDTTSYLLTGSGYYLLHDTLYKYAVEEKPWNHYFSRYVIWKGDTLRKEYCMNQGALNDYQHVVSVNHFVVYNGESKKHGEWKYYSNNNLDSVITYQHGVRNGRAVYYSCDEDSVVLQCFGNYKNDLKDGEWTFLADKIQITEQYISERQNAPLFTDAKDSVITTFVNGVADGSYRLYDGANGCLTKGSVAGGIAVGVWVYYDESGKVIRKINYKNGTSSKKKQENIALSK